jgi:hypothetical protein
MAAGSTRTKSQTRVADSAPASATSTVHQPGSTEATFKTEVPPWTNSALAVNTPSQDPMSTRSTVHVSPVQRCYRPYRSLVFSGIFDGENESWPSVASVLVFPTRRPSLREYLETKNREPRSFASFTHPAMRLFPLAGAGIHAEDGDALEFREGLEELIMPPKLRQEARVSGGLFS